MAHGTNQVDEIITSTLNAMEKSGAVQDIVFSGDPLLALLKSKGKVNISGGDEIRVNLRIAKNENVGSYSGADTLDTGEIDTLGHAKFQWKQYSGGFWVTELDLLKNAGNTTKIVDLWKEKVENTTLSLEDELVAGIYGDGLGNSGKDILGLKAILTDTGVLGGIDRAGLAAWKANVVDWSGETDKAPSIARIKSRIRAIRGPGGRPDKSGKVDMLLCNQEMFDYIEGLIDAKAHLDRLSGPVAELGFDTIRIAGAELTWTENVPSGEIWYISTEYLGIRTLAGRDFTFDGPISARVNNQDVRKAFLFWAGNMIVSNCKHLGRDTGFVIA